MISHPQLVQTGLDFFGKEPRRPTTSTAIVFYETGYNPFTMQQAARRAWRIGQSKDCRVYYLHYARHDAATGNGADGSQDGRHDGPGRPVERRGAGWHGRR